MNFLLDTHALIWWLIKDDRLGRSADVFIRDPDSVVWISAVSAYEVAQKHRRGKLPQVRRLAEAFVDEISAEGFRGLPIDIESSALAGGFDHPHKDPFDRLLIAQALTQNLVLLSNERVFDDFGVARIW